MLLNCYSFNRTVDLYEAKNMNQVIHCIHALARAARNAPGFSGPFMETTPNITPRVDSTSYEPFPVLLFFYFDFL
jgi:hypothetical protein